MIVESYEYIVMIHLKSLFPFTIGHGTIFLWERENINYIDISIFQSDIILIFF